MDHLLSLALVATLWAPGPGQPERPRQKSYGTETFTFAFDVREGEECDSVARGALRTKEGGQVRRTVWDATLVNNPFFAWVDQRGRWVVTVGTECGVYRKHAIVVFDRLGAVVRDLALDEVLTEDELPRARTEPDRGGTGLFRIGTRIEFEESQVWAILPWGRRVPLLK
jgi:hypothetical protein